MLGYLAAIRAIKNQWPTWLHASKFDRQTSNANSSLNPEIFTPDDFLFIVAEHAVK